MKKLVIVWATLTLILFSSISLAFEVSIVADSAQSSQKDSGIVYFKGNIVVAFEKSSKIKIESNESRISGKDIIFEGDVEFNFGKAVMKTEKAIVRTGDFGVTINMDSAKIIEI